jgi:hypothetical protein
MLATRGVFLAITGLVWALNGWALLQQFGILPSVPNMVPGLLVANMVIVPVVMWSAYRTGQLTEEAFRARKS